MLGKAVVHCSNDPLLGGDPAKMNPEDLPRRPLLGLSHAVVSALRQRRRDRGHVLFRQPIGRGEVGRGGAGRFVKVTLRPHVGVTPGTDLAAAEAIHHRIHEVCFIARSVNFPVEYARSFRSARKARRRLRRSSLEHPRREDEVERGAAPGATSCVANQTSCGSPHS